MLVTIKFNYIKIKMWKINHFYNVDGSIVFIYASFICASMSLVIIARPCTSKVRRLHSRVKVDAPKAAYNGISS